MRRHLIVGSGIAALSAAEEIRRRDAGARVTLVSAESHPFYSRPGLPYVLEGTIPEARLTLRSAQELRELDLARVHATACGIDTAEHRLKLLDGRELPYDRLLLATGAASIRPSFAGATMGGLHYLDGLDDARALGHAARRGQAAVVVGGGSTALELVEALVARGVRTHYLLRGDRYWARVLDAVESSLVESRLEAAGVAIHRRAEIARVLPGDVARQAAGRGGHRPGEAAGRPGQVALVETSAGERIPCDILAVAVGIRPRLELALAAGLETDRGILTDAGLRTSAPDVFAAGDVAQALDPVTGARLLDTLWSSAARQGRCAGANMAGGDVADRKAVALNVTRLAGITTTIAGEVGGQDDPDLVTLTRGQSERWRGAGDAWTLDGQHGADRLRVLLSHDRIVGAVVMGDQTLSRPLARLIAEQTDVSPLRAALEARPDALASILLELQRSLEPAHATLH